MKNFLKLFLAFLLLPLVFFTVAEVCGTCWNVFADLQNAIGFLAGAALYAVIHFSVYQFDRMYVFGHETTHAVAAMLFGFRVHDISVKKDSGHVKMDRCNAAVILAPYFIPFYALLTGIIYVGIGLFWPVENYRSVFIFSVGFFMAFHGVQTCKTLWETQQPDLKMAGGNLFSVVMIVLGNMLVLSLVLKCLFPQRVELLEMARGVFNSTYNTWKIVINYIIDRLISAQG
ncbi:MAG: M50 family metallopeptidase [Elusimicrobiaceae bacterium]|nr:M50 family metallopeptidase [Elusimicrobiaceae bacterium]